MDFGNDPNDRSRLGRERSGDPESSANRPHPPEQYPGYREDDRGGERELRDDRSGEVRDGRSYDERGYSQTDSRSGQPYQEQRRSGGKGWGITALVLSILAFLLAFLFAFLNIILALPALILGIVARRKGSRGLGLAAIVISILAILLGIVVTLVVGAALMNSPEFQQLMQEIQQQQ